MEIIRTIIELVSLMAVGLVVITALRYAQGLKMEHGDGRQRKLALEKHRLLMLGGAVALLFSAAALLNTAG